MKKISTLLLVIVVLCTKTLIAKCQTANVNDSLVLAQLFDSTGGPNWLNKTGWLNRPVKEWYGITLNSEGRVTAISLIADSLKGHLPVSLGGLNKLDTLDVGYNSLTGSIPDSLGSLSSLGYLSLHFNNFNDTLPASLGKLTKLYIAYINNNAIKGHIPESLGNLTNLNLLALANNKLTGDIPSALGNLTKLAYFFAGNNQLTGSIPQTFSNLSSTLSDLEINDNLLTGSLPDWLGNCTGLFFLRLQNNHLTGAIPSTLGNLKNLQELDLNNNLLTGIIPSTLGNLSRLQILALQNNQLSDTLTASLGNLNRVMTINISYNKLTGSLPASLGNLPNLEDFRVQNNLLSGAIPVTFTNISTLYSCFLNDNYFTFNGMEQFAQKYNDNKFSEYAPQNIIPLQYDISNKKLFVSAGGTIANNTYKWYKGDTLVATVNGDPTFKPADTGNYQAVVSNTIATKLTLYTDTFTITPVLLPVNLLGFTIEEIKAGNMLKWQTAAEINSAYFIVQRSIDGLQFSNVTKIAAAGNSGFRQVYQYTDNPSGLYPIPSKILYRLQQVDKDGAVTYSKIVAVKTNTDNPALLVLYPNPVHNTVKVQLNGLVGLTSITLLNAGGKTLQAQRLNVANGQLITFNIQTQPSGIYFIQIQQGKQRFVQKFIKQ